MTTAIFQLKEFIDSCPSKWRARNAWLEDDKLRAYVRYSSRVLDKKTRVISTCLDVAVIAVNMMEWNKGHCREFIHTAHELNPWDATFIECANSPVLDAALKRWGFTFNGLDSYFKMTKALNTVSK